MYTIIGADQREYGPVDAAQVRDWIAEGRANGATLVRTETAPAWAPLSSFAEFADVLGAPAAGAHLGADPATPPPGDPAAFAEYVRRRDYDLDVGLCLTKSWELFKNNAGLLIAASVIFVIVVVGVNQVIGLFARGPAESVFQGDLSPGSLLALVLLQLPEMALTAILTGGLYTIVLRLVRGQETGLGDLFAGFNSSVVFQLALAGIVVQVLTMLGLLACIAPGVYLAAAWLFTVPLIMDRKYDFWSAMEVSRKAVTLHWWRGFLVLALVAVLGVLGLLACCVGLIATLPIGLGTLIYAYETIFGGPGPSSSSESQSLVLPGH
jgi:uncharacterized membrane protein